MYNASYRPSIRGCLHGLSGLLALDSSDLKQDSILAVADTLLGLHIPGLTQADRMLALSTLLLLLKVPSCTPLSQQLLRQHCWHSELPHDRRFLLSFEAFHAECKHANPCYILAYSHELLDLHLSCSTGCSTGDKCKVLLTGLTTQFA